jgi:glycosyltransferase involved in cell wall biosynthesis
MSITVVIPVGPSEANKRWLQECIESVYTQTLLPDQVLVIDDGADLSSWPPDLGVARNKEIDGYHVVDIYVLPWRTGISHAFNYGVALARNECVFLLGSDDTLEPTCLERCWEAYNKRDKQDAYYSVPVRYLSTGEVQTIPCNAAMVTKGFWKMTGGFPIESAIGRGDNALLSICMNRPELPVVWVGHETGHDLEPLYNYREHLGQWTPYANRYAPELISIINKLTEDWTTPEWVENYNV